MKPTQNAKLPPLLAFGAHPDDIEFGCGAVVFNETSAGRPAHFVVCSRGETASNGSPEQRAAEAEQAATILGASIEFIELDGDAHLEMRVEHAIKLAQIIRRVKPSTVLAPSCVENQHPDHSRLGRLLRDAARMARYGGFAELRGQEAHNIEQLFFYAITPEGEPTDISPTIIDISAPEVVASWTAAMNAHMSQSASRNYVDLQLARARVLGERAGVAYAMALYSNDPLIYDSIAQTGRGARRY